MLSLIPGCQHRRLLGLSYEEEFTQYALHLLAGMTFFHSITLDLFFDRSIIVNRRRIMWNILWNESLHIVGERR